MSTKSEARAKLKEQKKLFAETDIPEEFNQHKWKKHSDFIACKICGLIKGSGFSKCEPPKPEGGE